MHYQATAISLATEQTPRTVNLAWIAPDTAVVLRQYPPAFSALVAIPIAAGFDPINAARVILAISAGMWIALVVRLVSSVLDVFRGVLIAAVVFVLPATLLSHQSLLSEPPFLVAVFGMIAAMYYRPGSPLLYGTLAALSSLIRYLGLGMIVSACLWAMFQPGSLATRLRRGILAGIPSLALQGWWQLYISGSGDGLTSFHLRGRLGVDMRRAAGAISRWIAPGIEHNLIRLAATVLVILALGLLAWHYRVTISRILREQRPLSRLVQVCGLVAATYLAVLVFLRLFAEYIFVDQRTLLPVFVLVTLVIALVVSALRHELTVFHRRIVYGVAIAWLAGAIMADLAYVRQSRDPGIEYAEARRLKSPTMEWIRRNAQNRPIFSNHAGAVYFGAERFSRAMPQVWTDADLRTFADTVRARRGLIVTFREPYAKVEAAKALVESLPVKLEATFPDAEIWSFEGGP